MDCLRRGRVEGRSVLQTPVVHLRRARDGRRATLVLTVHLAEPAYFAGLNAAIRDANAQVFFESIRSVDASTKHWDEKYHRLLRAIREDLYLGIAELGLFSFQAEYLAPSPDWVNSDVTCCEFAAKLREAKVSTVKYELALAVFMKFVQRAKSGDREARRAIEAMLKKGLLAVSVLPLLELQRFLPGMRGFQSVAADWRNDVAVAKVDAESDGDFVLVYGAAHGPGLISLLRKRGFVEVDREWHTAFST